MELHVAKFAMVITHQSCTPYVVIRLVYYSTHGTRSLYIGLICGDVPGAELPPRVYACDDMEMDD